MMEVFDASKIPWSPKDANDHINSKTERALRAYANGEMCETMTAQQRSWCIEEALELSYGYYSRKELMDMNDLQLAKAVLYSWAIYILKIDQGSRDAS